MNDSHSHATEVWNLHNPVSAPRSLCKACNDDGYQLVKVFYAKKTPRNGMVDFRRAKCPACGGKKKKVWNG